MKKSLSRKRPITSILALIFLVTIFMGCNDHKSSAFPEDFVNKTDTAKIAFLMEKVNPDSVARFIGYSALYENDSIRRIKDFPQAVRFAYIKYNEQDRIPFSIALQKFTDSIPLEKRLYIYKLASPGNLDRLGFLLGKDYLETENYIPGKLDDSQIEKINIINVFKKICNSDTASFKSFLEGFTLAIKSAEILLNEP